MRPVCHRDGTVTYWSVYNRYWVKRAKNIPDREMAAMSSQERDRVKKHMGG